MQVVLESVKRAIEAAEELRAYLSRSRDDWSMIGTFQLLSEHLTIFLELAVDESFIMKLGVDTPENEPGSSRRLEPGCEAANFVFDHG